MFVNEGCSTTFCEIWRAIPSIETQWSRRAEGAEGGGHAAALEDAEAHLQEPESGAGDLPNSMPSVNWACPAPLCTLSGELIGCRLADWLLLLVVAHLFRSSLTPWEH